MKGNLLSSLYEYYTLNFGYLMELFFQTFINVYLWRVIRLYYWHSDRDFNFKIYKVIMAYYYYREYYPDSSSNRDVSNTYASTWVGA